MFLVVVEVDTIEPNEDGTNDIGKMLGAKGPEYDASNFVMKQPGVLAGTPVHLSVWWGWGVGMLGVRLSDHHTVQLYYNNCVQ